MAARMYADERELAELQNLLSPSADSCATTPISAASTGSFASNNSDYPPDDEQFSKKGSLNANSKRRSTPVPYLQVFFIAIWRMSQPLSFGVILPFINNMLVHDLQVADEVHVGHYSGLVESVCSIGVVLGVLIFARLSAEYGRKWPTLAGVGLSCLFSAGFGFGKYYWQLVILRFLTGVAGGAQGATAKVMTSEITDSTNVNVCFALLGLGWQVGGTIAPVIGGFASRPADHWPSLFSGTLFERFPYGLPGMITASIPGITLLFAIFWMEETHPELKKGAIRRRPAHKAKQSDFHPAMIIQRQSLWDKLKVLLLGDNTGLPSLWSCGEGFILVLWSLIIFQIVSMFSAEILFFFSSKSIGGLELTQTQMSIVFALRPCLTSLYEINFYPPLAKKYGNVPMLKFLIFIPVVICSIYLSLAWAATVGIASTALSFSALAVVIVLQTVSNPIFLACDVLIPARSPTSQQLTTINALGEIIAQLAITCGAAGGSSLFAFGAETQRPLFVWFILWSIMMGTALLAQKLTHIDGWREKEEGYERVDAQLH